MLAKFRLWLLDLVTARAFREANEVRSMTMTPAERDSLIGTPFNSGRRSIRRLLKDPYDYMPDGKIKYGEPGYDEEWDKRYAEGVRIYNQRGERDNRKNAWWRAKIR